ncbi:NAD(P)H-hydrate dehydratase [Futiania mangrovi]|uniref:Bifunctional NAD(P)H-hydrate repair enzyme n=1 Tax=Futiania mangrovi TaxID=2959716 RepID=A0A9J6PCQ7_9PROT|nr:NAD(P)H-hydrate dehydratase [Futiania mangrovii]MCP1335584.1 NAD(P)H-hydrate dehydratase [Futiania mangrovii]
MQELFGLDDWAAPVPLLTPREMGQADAAAIAAGTPGTVLMARAGRAVADAVLRRLGHRQGRRAAVLCGPGNNGGDGFVAARLLAEEGVEATVYLLGARGDLGGDAADAARQWLGEVHPLQAALDLAGLDEASQPHVWIDALFGAGLSRPLEGVARRLVEALDASDADIVAVDVPSGLDGATGEVRGAAARAVETVTFATLKPGHLLYPGRALCGALTVADIGIPEAAVTGLAPKAFANAPGLWRGAFPVPEAAGHKYTRGHLGVLSGPAVQSGAARLAARGALRAGAGLVSMICAPSAAMVLASHLTAVMVKPVRAGEAAANLMARHRISTLVAGPGLGTDESARERLLAALAAPAEGEGLTGLVLDADALTLLAERGEGIADRMPPRTVLTPHEGEFARLVPDLGLQAAGQRLSRLDRARTAAERLGSVVLLKGPDTVVAAPDGRTAIAANAPAWLATAGSGDVLAGIVGGLLAQGMPAFEAACAAAWMHGAAAEVCGPGLIAEDLPEALPQVAAALIGDAGLPPPIHLAPASEP